MFNMFNRMSFASRGSSMVYDTETPSSGHVAQRQPSHTVQTHDDVDAGSV